MSDGFLEALASAVGEAVEDPGRPCASETFVIWRPDDWTDAQWDDFIAAVALHVGIPSHSEYGELDL